MSCHPGWDGYDFNTGGRGLQIASARGRGEQGLPVAFRRTVSATLIAHSNEGGGGLLTNHVMDQCCSTQFISS